MLHYFSVFSVGFKFFKMLHTDTCDSIVFKLRFEIFPPYLNLIADSFFVWSPCSTDKSFFFLMAVRIQVLEK